MSIGISLLSLRDDLTLRCSLFITFVSVLVCSLLPCSPNLEPLTCLLLQGCHLILQIRQPVNNQTVGTSIELDAWATQLPETEVEDLTPDQTMQRI